MRGGSFLLTTYNSEKVRGWGWAKDHSDPPQAPRAWFCAEYLDLCGKKRNLGPVVQRPISANPGLTP